MAKLDGMDPKLVREMLAQVQQAAKKMDAIEAQVTKLTRAADLSVQVMHRPAQIADACSTMVKDVTNRLAILEKRDKRDGGKPPTGKPATGKDLSADGDTTRPADTTSKDTHLAGDDESKNEDKSKNGDKSKNDAPKGEDKSKAEDKSKNHDKPDEKPKADSKGADEKQHHVGDGKSQDKGDEKPKSDAKGHDERPRHDSSDSGRHQDKDDDKPRNNSKGQDERPHRAAYGDGKSPDTSDDKPRSDSKGYGEQPSRDNGDGDRARPESKGYDEQPSRDNGDGDRARPESKSYDEQPTQDTSGDDRSRGDSGGRDERSSGEKPEGRNASSDDSNIYDTLKKDHPDDIDQTAGRQVISVDGVKVVSTPMNQPTDEYLAWLNEHMDQISPVDGPTVGDSSDKITGPHPDGPPGYIDPVAPGHGSGHEPAHGGPASGSTHGPTHAPVYDPAYDSARASGDPRGDIVLTGADNVTDDPAARPAYTQPAGGSGDDMVLTAADNVTDDPAERAATYAGPDADSGTDGTDRTDGDSRAGSVGAGDERVGTGSRSTADPRSVVIVEPGEVLSIQVTGGHGDGFDERVIRTVADHHRDIGPLDMPDVSRAAGESIGGEIGGEDVILEIELDDSPGPVERHGPGGRNGGQP